MLFDDGSWAAVAEDGSLSGDAPGLGTRIILNPGGTWQVLAASTSPMRIPSLAAGNAASTGTGSNSSAPNQSSAPSQESSATVSDSAEAQYHVIKSGDTLDKISKTYHTTIDRLCELNGITRKTILHIGRRLRVR